MKRRETYPCAKLEETIQIVEELDQGTDGKSKNKDAYRLSELLGFIKKNTVTQYIVTDKGRELIARSPEEQRIVLFCCLVKKNEVLPSYFSLLMRMQEIHDRAITIDRLCELLNINDLWSADILHDWCRYLTLSKGSSTNEIYISSSKLSSLQRRAFLYLLQKTYRKYKGRSGLVPVSKLRNVLKNAGVLRQGDDFDEWMLEIYKDPLNSSKIKFYPAPSRFVGRGLRGQSGFELVNIQGELNGA